MNRPVVLGCLVLLAAWWPVAARAAGCPPPPFTPDLHTVPVGAPASTLELRVARTPETREYGLMCVRSLPANGGMIFVFPTDQLEDFWMRNTLISLDQVWVHPDGTVSFVADHVPATSAAQPGEDTHRDGAGMYVIELPAGGAARAGIAVGRRLDLAHVPAARE